MIQNRTIYPKNVLPSNSLRSWLSFQHFKVAISPKWRENRHYRVSSKKKGLQTVITFLIHIFDCFFRILILDLLKYCFKFFRSFLPMGFSVLEHKCKDLTSKMIFLEIRYLGNWSLWTNNFFRMIISELVLNNGHIFRNGKTFA